MGKLECIQSNSFLVAANLRCRTSRRHGTDAAWYKYFQPVAADVPSVAADLQSDAA